MRSFFNRVHQVFVFSAVSAALLIAGCDTLGDDPSGREDEFEADLRAMNTQAGTTVTGEALLVVDDAFLHAEVDADGMAPGITHAQHIHAAGTCPPASADTNGDGYVDVVEGLPFYGAILIPLDDNLSSQAQDTFPTADSNGQLEYDQVRNLASILDDLRGEDPDPNDAFAKLGNGELNLEARTVVLHGVDPSVNLPSTVQSLPGLPAHATLPVACGEVQQTE